VGRRTADMAMAVPSSAGGDRLSEGLDDLATSRATALATGADDDHDAHDDRGARLLLVQAVEAVAFAQALRDEATMLIAEERWRRGVLEETRIAARASVRRSGTRRRRTLRGVASDMGARMHGGLTRSRTKAGDLGDVHRLAAHGDAAATALLVERYTGLAKSLALRGGRGHDHTDDAVQVAMYALLRAIERFDPDRGVAFSTFAHATIDGELKRYRRRTAWMLHVPRRSQELYLEASAALDDIGHRVGREPTVAEVAAAIGASEDEVREVLEFRHLQRPMSLDAPVGDDDGGSGRDVRDDDVGFVAVERRDLVERLLDRLEPREREIVELRFVENLTQSEIAQRIGLSQMHVSRLLRSALDRLRVLGADR
jgi:RNA polymerase sigma-B factor